MPAIFSAALFAALALASCKSAPTLEAARVNAIDALDGDALVYMSIPAKAHSELTAGLIKSSFGQDIPDKYVKNVMDGIDTIFIGMGSARDRQRLQVACDGTLSSTARLALNSSDYFSKSIQNVGQAGVYQVFTEKKSLVQIASPASGLILISSDILPQLELYDAEARAAIVSAAISEGEIGSAEALEIKNREWKESQAYRFIGGEGSQNVRLFMNRPLSFITNLLGTNLSSSIFQLNYIEGDFSRLPSGNYSVDLEMEFSKDNLISRAMAFLKVALMMTDSKISASDGRHLSISGIQVSLSQMQRMLGIK